MKTPSPTEIKALRKAHKLTQTQAANMIYKALRTWQQWERGDREMDGAFWELFKIKCSMNVTDKSP